MIPTHPLPLPVDTGEREATANSSADLTADLPLLSRLPLPSPVEGTAAAAPVLVRGCCHFSAKFDNVTSRSGSRIDRRVYTVGARK